MSERRVVITGIGCISPLGNDLETTWDGLKNGRSGIRTIEGIDPTPFDCKIAGEVRDFNADGYFGMPKDARRSDRYVQFAVAASKMAMADSGLDTEKIDARRYGVMVGSGIGGLSTLEREHSVYIEKGPRRVSPFTIPMMISNIASGIISMEHGLLGPNMVIVTACATSNHNIGEASRPFDKHRDGFVMGEGAGVVMIEELETAKARGAKIYAELIGYGVSADAYHLSAPSPDGSGPAYAIGMALKHGKTNPEEVDYLNAHATSTGLGDVAETKAIKLAFGDYANNGLMVSSTKSMTGHMLGAAGGIELIASVMGIVDGVVPPTINIEEQDPECDLDVVPNVAREVPIKVALSNSFGFGGHNASVLVRKFED
jgi:3-oxoacyl-[acyl-carrier-protein] synthase II